MVARTQSHDDYINKKEDQRPRKVCCVRCEGVLFFAITSFLNKKHGFTIKCKKCGCKNRF